MTTLRADVARKDAYISELLDRLAIVECEVKNEKLVSCALECLSLPVYYTLHGKAKHSETLRHSGSLSACSCFCCYFTIFHSWQEHGTQILILFCCEVWKNLEIVMK